MAGAVWAVLPSARTCRRRGGSVSFDVDPTALDALRQLLERGSQDASAMKSYWHNNAGVDFTGEGIINLFRDTDDKIESNVEKYFDTLSGHTMPGVAEAVARAGKYYRSTDAAAAERLDGSMPSTDVTAATRDDLQVTADYLHPSPAFSDVAEPTNQLKALPDFNATMPYQPAWTDLASPTSLLRDAIWAVTKLGVMLGICDRQYDIFEVVLKPVCGDWAGIKATGATMTNLANATIDLHVNLGHAILGMNTAWHGNAADAASAHFHLIRKSLFDAGVALTKLGAEYDGAAEACYSMSSTIGAILGDITDAAVAAAVAGAATGALTASGVGVPAALVLGAFTLTKVYRVVKEVFNIIKIIADMTARVNALRSAVGSTSGDFGKIDGSFTPFGLPETPALPR
ncbi:hypothetical protein HC031_05740 [Planosporangium thailandense]|uniref:WXG100 family type VII secretion target n=1 Tax=Planosporangium thailandense TaxID=765197 RepID=A0ABX0XTS0_9ACTN|nr:hypothetical protein [Planosporangium thailandense]NJC69221.1 hypothetical protein [Planosporangium thailandense]